MEYTLKHDVEVDGVVVHPAGTVLKLRRPKARDMIAIGDHLPALAALDSADPGDAMSGATFRAMIAIAGTISGLGEDVAMDLDSADLMALSMEASSLLGEAIAGGTPAIGDAPLPKPPAP